MQTDDLIKLKKAITRLINANKASLHANAHMMSKTADRKARERDNLLRQVQEMAVSTLYIQVRTVNQTTVKLTADSPVYTPG